MIAAQHSLVFNQQAPGLVSWKALLVPAKTAAFKRQSLPLF
jgi:uncharacterized protein YfdQ (DUF2303 family)